MDFGEEDGGSDSFGCHHIGVGVRHALDQAVESESAQVIGHLVHAVVVAEESGHQPAKALVGKTGDGVDDTTQGAGQGHGAWIPEAQGSGSLALPVVGLVDALKERSADGTALAGTFDHKHAMVDLPGLVDELGQMTDPSEKPQVRRLVDDGLDAIGPPFFQVLLDAAVLVTKVHLHLGPGAEHPGREGLLGRLAHLAGEDDRNFLGTANPHVVGDEGLEEPPGPAGVVKDERPRHLDLAHGELPPIPRIPVLFAEGVRDGSVNRPGLLGGSIP